jgi:APA family basic amino acid/polyamine antiporter
MNRSQHQDSAGSSEPQGDQLKRGLGLLEATTLVVGGIIGSGIFLVPSLVAREMGSAGLSLMVWVICGLLSICGALCFAELSSAVPETGGPYAYLRRAYPTRLISFLYGWTAFFVIRTASIAAVAAAFASYAGYFLSGIMPYGPWTQRLVAVVAILFLAILNSLGVRVGGKFQNYLTYTKVSALLGLIGVGMLFGHGDWNNFTPLLPSGTVELGMFAAFGTAMIPTLFAYNGWAFSTFVAGETRNPERNIPRSILLGIGIVMAVYLLANVVYFYVLPFDQVQTSTLVAADTMQSIIGRGGAAVISAMIVVSAFATMNVQLLTTSRIYFAMSRNNQFFRVFDRVHPRFRTPVVAIMAQGIWACGFALSGTYAQIITYLQFPQQFFNALGVSCIILLRRREPDLNRPYRAWGYPVTPILYLLVIGWFLVNSLAFRFSETMVGVTLLLSGIPFYFYFRNRGERSGEAVQG